MRIGSVEILRCIAGTFVLWYHLSLNVNNDFLRWTGSLGWCGVQIFFVVSGFIIPYSMQKSGYKFPRDIGSFLVRRLVRLDPPYLVASAAAAVIACMACRAPGFLGPPPDINWSNMIAHVGYLNGILGMKFYIQACWTLGIELQFYILMAISFPLWVSSRGITFFCAASITCLATWYFVHNAVKPEDPWFFSWAPYFILGIAGFRYREGLGNGLEFTAVAGMSLAVAWLTGNATGAAAGILAALFMTFMNVPLPNFLQKYASITYSLYLVHMPVGERAVRLVERLGSNIVVDLAALTAGLIVSFAAAFLLLKYVEVPAMRWSKIVAPGRSKPAESPA